MPATGGDLKCWGFFGQTGEGRSEHLCLPCRRLLWLGAESSNFGGCGTGVRAVGQNTNTGAGSALSQQLQSKGPAEAVGESCAGVAEILAAGFS